MLLSAPKNIVTDLNSIVFEYAKTKNRKRAIKRFLNVLKTKKHPVFYTFCGSLYNDIPDYDKARFMLEKSINLMNKRKLLPNHNFLLSWTLKELGIIFLFNEKKYDKALATFEKAKKIVRDIKENKQIISIATKQELRVLKGLTAELDILYWHLLGMRHLTKGSLDEAEGSFMLVNKVIRKSQFLGYKWMYHLLDLTRIDKKIKSLSECQAFKELISQTRRLLKKIISLINSKFGDKVPRNELFVSDLFWIKHDYLAYLSSILSPRLKNKILAAVKKARWPESRIRKMLSLDSAQEFLEDYGLWKDAQHIYTLKSFKMEIAQYRCIGEIPINKQAQMIKLLTPSFTLVGETLTKTKLERQFNRVIYELRKLKEGQTDTRDKIIRLFKASRVGEKEPAGKKEGIIDSFYIGGTIPIPGAPAGGVSVGANIKPEPLYRKLAKPIEFLKKFKGRFKKNKGAKSKS